jgi:DNA-binding XRE family transcriptional regulator
MYPSAVPQLQVGQLTCQFTSAARHSQALDELSQAPFAIQSATQIDLATPPAPTTRLSTIRYTHSMEPASAGALLRQARKRVNLSQVDLAARAGVTQSVISAHESGQRQPSIPVLARLVDAAGFEPALGLRRRPAPCVG